MRLVKDSLGRAELVGALDDDGVLEPTFERPQPAKLRPAQKLAPALRRSLDEDAVIDPPSFRPNAPRPAAPSSGSLMAARGAKVSMTIDREVDSNGDYWIAFLKREGGKPGDFVTFGSRHPKDVRNMAQEFANKYGLKVVRIGSTKAAQPGGSAAQIVDAKI